MDKAEAPSQQEAIDSIVLEEEIDPNYVPSEAEVIEYAKWLGMDLEADKDLYWIAREGLMAPLPANWKPCKTKDTEDIYYFNFSSGESTWDHPCDGYYKRLYEEEKKKKEVSLKENNDSKRTQAKQDIQQLIGKKEKKAPKKLKAEPMNFEAEQKPSLSLAPVLERKPLPGLKTLGSIGSSPLTSATSMPPVSQSLPLPLSRSSTPERKPLSNDLPAPTLRNSEELFTSEPKSFPNKAGIGSISQSKEVSRSETSISQQSMSYKEDESVSSSVESGRSSHKNFLVHKGLDNASRKGLVETAFDQTAPSTNNYTNEDKRTNYEDNSLLKEQLSKLQEENSKLLYKISFHEVEIKNSKQELDSMSQRLERMRLLEDELSKTKLELRSRESDSLHHQNRAVQLEGENRKLLDQLSQKDQESYQMKSKHMEATNVEITKFQQLDLQHNQLKFTLTMKDQENDRISKELMSLKTMYDQLLQTSTNNATLASSNGGVSTDTNETLVKTLQLQLQQQQQQLKQAQEQVAQLQQQLVQQQSADHQAQHKIQQLEIENKSYQENIRQQQKDLLHLQQKQAQGHPSIETAVASDGNQQEMLQLQLQQKISELQQLQEKYKAVESQYQNQLQQVTKLELENTQLSMKISTSSSSSSMATQMVEQLQKQQAQQMQQSQDHIAQLQQQLSQLQSKEFQTQQQSSQYQFRIQQLEGDMKLQQQTISLKESEITQMRQQMQSFNQQIAELQQNASKVSTPTANNSNNSLVTTLQMQLQQQTLDMQSVQDKYKLVEGQYQIQVQQSSQLEVEHAQLSMKLSSATSNISFNTQFIEQLQQQIAQSQQKYQQLEGDYRTLQLDYRKVQEEFQSLTLEHKMQLAINGAMTNVSPMVNNTSTAPNVQQLHQLELQQLQEKCKVLESQYQQQLQQGTQLEIENSQLQMKVSSATVSATMNTQFVEQFQKQTQQQLQQAQDQVSQLQQQLLQQQLADQQTQSQLQQQFSQAKQKIHQLEIENKSYQENIRQQQKEISQLQQQKQTTTAVTTATHTLAEPMVSMQDHMQLQLQCQQKSSELQQMQEKCKLIESQYQLQLQQTNEHIAQVQQQSLSQQLAQQSKELATQQQVSQLQHKNQQLEMKATSYQDTIAQLQQQIQQQQQYILQLNTNTNAATTVVLPPPPPPPMIVPANAFEAKLNSVATSEVPKLSLDPTVEKAKKRGKHDGLLKKDPKKRGHKAVGGGQGQSTIKKELPLAESPIYYTSDQSWEYSSSENDDDDDDVSSDKHTTKPHHRNHHKKKSDSDDLTSVSEVHTTPIIARSSSQDSNHQNFISMAQVVSNLTEAIYHLKLYNAPTNRELARHLQDQYHSHPRSSSSSSGNGNGNGQVSIRQLLEQRYKDEHWFYEQLLMIMSAAKSYIRKHRQQIQQMKQSWKKKNASTDMNMNTPEKDAINIATNDINLVIRFLRQLQSSITIRKEQLEALKQTKSIIISGSTKQSHSISREVGDTLKEIFHRLDEDVRAIYEEINMIARSFISSTTGGAENTTASPEEYLRLESPLIPSSTIPPRVTTTISSAAQSHYPHPYLYPSDTHHTIPLPAAAATAASYYYPHPYIHQHQPLPSGNNNILPQHVIDGKKLLLATTGSTTGGMMSNHPSKAAKVSSSSSSSAMSYIPSIDLDQQLQSVTNQLNSAQYKQRECIQHFDRHRDWLGDLIKEVGGTKAYDRAAAAELHPRLKSTSNEELNIPNPFATL